MASLEGCVELARDGHLKLGQVSDFVCTIHTLPFIQPISLGPLATAGVLSLGALGRQMMRGRDTPWLPARVRAIDAPATEGPRDRRARPAPGRVPYRIRRIADGHPLCGRATEQDEDRAMVIVAFVFLLLTLACFALIFWALISMGDKAWGWLRSLLSR